MVQARGFFLVLASPRYSSRESTKPATSDALTNDVMLEPIQRATENKHYLKNRLKGLPGHRHIHRYPYAASPPLRLQGITISYLSSTPPGYYQSDRIYATCERNTTSTRDDYQRPPGIVGGDPGRRPGRPSPGPAKRRANKAPHPYVDIYPRLSGNVSTHTTKDPATPASHP